VVSCPQRPAHACVVVAVSFVVSASLAAKFFTPDLENIPVQRLVANLERLAKEYPGDARLVFNLGRAHAMAYALKVDTLPVERGGDSEGPWPGHRAEHMQPDVKPAPNAAADKIARGHLTRAIARYREALTYDDDRTGLGRLSLGWALAQAGENAGAVAALRAVVQVAWPQERTIKGQMAGWRSLTEEAALYLIPLLDSDKDREEIATLRGYVAVLEKTPRMITPIAVPLRDGLNALDIADASARVLFDADGSGRRRSWTWLTRDAGWLVYDHRGTRRIDTALQMFGGVSFWMFWDNGYQALRALDDNADGRIAGRELRGLAIWRDHDANGRSDRGEVLPVAAWSIVSLSYDHVIDAAHPDEIAYAPCGVTFADGSSRPTFDLVLRH
jgi:hypothetical protein